MVQSSASTIADYLAALPDDRRKAIRSVRQLVRKHLPKGYREVMQSGMIAWVVPLSRYPKTYNGEPLPIVALASQKASMSLYLMGVYADAAARKAFERAYAASGKKLDMGKSCLRFKRVEDLAPEAIAVALAATPVERFLELYEASRR